MSRRAPSRADHQKFCEREGWTQVRNARGRSGTHHIAYELTLPDGRILRTRISHPPDRSTYGRALWGHILRDQLEVTPDQFWDCVRNKVVPRRGRTQQVGDGIPASVVHQLIALGVPEGDVAGMSKSAALQRLTELGPSGQPNVD